MKCDAFKDGCTSVARHHVEGYDLCTPCAQAFAGYTPDVTYYNAAELADILADTVDAYLEAIGRGILHAEIGLRQVITTYRLAREEEKTP